MSSVVALHCLPGTVAGSVFAVRTLLIPGGARFDGVRWGDDRVGALPWGFGHWEA